MAAQRTYLAIDLKSFYASVECVDRHLDPLTTNLVVADASRTEKTICRTGTETVGRNVQKTGAVPAPLPLQYNSRRAYRQWYLQGESPAPARWDTSDHRPM